MLCEITPERAEQIMRGEYLGGYGWAWDSSLGAWVAGGEYWQPDGTVISVEQRRFQDSAGAQHPRRYQQLATAPVHGAPYAYKRRRG